MIKDSRFLMNAELSLLTIFKTGFDTRKAKKEIKENRQKLIIYGRLYFKNFYWRIFDREVIHSLRIRQRDHVQWLGDHQNSLLRCQCPFEFLHRASVQITFKIFLSFIHIVILITTFRSWKSEFFVTLSFWLQDFLKFNLF